MRWKSVTYLKNGLEDYCNVGVWSNDRNLINELQRVVKEVLEKKGWIKDQETKG